MRDFSVGWLSGRYKKRIKELEAEFLEQHIEIRVMRALTELEAVTSQIEATKKEILAWRTAPEEFIFDSGGSILHLKCPPEDRAKFERMARDYIYRLSDLTGQFQTRISVYAGLKDAMQKEHQATT